MTAILRGAHGGPVETTVKCSACSHPTRFHNADGCVRGDCECTLAHRTPGAPRVTMPAPERPRRPETRPAAGARLVAAEVGEHDADTPVEVAASSSPAATSTPQPEEPAVDVPTQPADEPLTIEELLAVAGAIERLQPRVAEIRGLVADLRTALAVAAKVRAAEARVERLQAELAAAREELERLATGAPVAEKPAAEHPAAEEAGPAELEPHPREVREWAATQGITVAQRGALPRTVVEQYLAALHAA